MNSIRELKVSEFPKQLLEIPVPPKKLFIRGVLPDKNTVLITIVGTRKPTKYGIEACEKFIAGLSGLPVAIVSGLALGIDSVAHKAAMKAKIPTIAVPGSGISDAVIYPRSHIALAKEIITQGGCLISEFEPDFEATTWSFPQRNRIMAGLSKAVFVIEAERKSGTLVTAKYATDTNRDIYALPGNVTSPMSEGPNWLIRMGATPITSADDLREALGFSAELDRKNLELDLDQNEKKVYEILNEAKTRDEIGDETNMQPHEISAIISMLEIKGLISESAGKIRRSF
jgi:DNA processing protein